MHQARYTLGGFTLIELIIAMVITSVLLMISLPAYQQQLVRARRALARAELQEVAVRQEQYFLDHRRYASSLRDLGYPDDPMVLDEQGNNLPGSAGGIYRIELSMLDDVYTVYASTHTAHPGDPHCGRLSVSALGVKGISGRGTLNECW
jgi:type IV pilus assembly protein PilE